MPSTSSRQSSSIPSQPDSSTAPYVFLFLEIFSREGGIQSYVKDIFAAYLTLAHQPKADVFLLRDGPESHNPFEAAHLKFHYLKSPAAILGRIRFATVLFIYLLRNRPQRIFCGHINLAPLVRSLARPLKIPYTVLTYGKEVWSPLPPSFQNALQAADTIWTISRYSRDCACAANHLNPSSFRLLPCAVDGDRFTPGPKSEELVKTYGLSGANVLMTVARLWSGDIYKGVDVTIRALPKILEIFPNVKYLVIGRGDDQPRLAQLATDLGVTDQVVFAGFVPTEQLVEHYRLADAYIMPSQEGFGIVYLEAMACEVPVLSGDSDGSADPLQDGQLGWRVPHRDPEAVAQACIEILTGIHSSLTASVNDPRYDGKWLRQQAIRLFGKAAFNQQLDDLLSER
jgi:glycosyltransferase involved in cell wall biosynthesis